MASATPTPCSRESASPHSNRGPCRLLIVDNRCLCREGLRSLFREAQGFDALAVDCGQAEQMIDYFAPDVALISLLLPGHYALRAARYALQARSARVVFLDDELRHANVSATLTVGAHGYWTQGDSFAELAAAVQTVAGGGCSFCPAAEQYVETTENGYQLRRDVGVGEIAKLTKRELEVFSLLVKGFSTKQCARQLNIAESTADNFKTKIMRKFDVHTRTELLRVAIREGFGV